MTESNQPPAPPFKPSALEDADELPTPIPPPTAHRAKPEPQRPRALCYTARMEFISENWGSLASALGLLVSLGGLIWAIRAARGARTAAQSAEKAATQTRRAIRRDLTVMDIERANARLEALKVQHRSEQWEVALAAYPEILNMLYDIRNRLTDESYNDMSWAVDRIYDIQDAVEQGRQSSLYPNAANLNRTLSQIQSRLRNIHVGNGSERDSGEE